jgi:hypothetical protein
MAKSRKRRRKQPTAERNIRKAPSQKQTAENMQGTKAQPARTFRGWLHENYPKLAKVGGLVTGVPTVLAFYHSTIPDIHPLSGSAPADPFRLPFVIENKNAILPMDKIIIRCLVDHLKYNDKGVSTIDDVGFQSSSGSEHIPPKSQANYFCAISNLYKFHYTDGTAVPVSSAEISVRIDYETPIFHHDWSRRFPFGPFIWRSGVAGDQWMTGPVVQ